MAFQKILAPIKEEESNKLNVTFSGSVNSNE
jgi:hypothetical protein